MRDDGWVDIPDFLKSDYETVAADKALGWETLEGKTILVTGATGEIGSEIIKTLLWARKTRNLSFRIIGLARSLEKVRNVFNLWRLDNPQDFEFVYGDIRIFNVTSPIDYVIHTASPTDSRDFVQKPVETLEAIADGTRHVLDIAREKNVSGLVFLSSMEVYGQIHSENVREEDCGPLNPLSVRSSYPQAKRFAETLVASYVAQYGVPAKIVRPTQVFGTHLGGNDSRVYAQFARAVRDGRNIVLHTKGQTCRDYIYTIDAVRAILTVLLRGKTGEAYNISNPDNFLSIRQLADLAASFSLSSRVVVDEEKGKSMGYAPTVCIRLNIDKLDELNPFSKTPIETMFGHLVEDCL